MNPNYPCLRLGVACLLAAAVSPQVLAIGRFPDRDAAAIPARYANSIVRVAGRYVEGPQNNADEIIDRNSGVVVDVRQDVGKNSGFICILTSDHGIGSILENPAGANRRDREWRLGFGNGNANGRWDHTATSGRASSRWTWMSGATVSSS